MIKTQTFPKHILSKSTFLRGNQCEKSLWLYKHNYNLRDEISDARQMIFDRGTQVGELAQQLFTGGADASPIDPFHYQDSVLLTQKLIDEGTKTIYEAAFQYDKVLAAADIMVNTKGKWKCYEVKSSTEVKDVHYLDAALQYYVITQSGIKLDDISIVYINNQYVREGELDLKKFFITQSVMKEVLAMQKDIPAKIAELKSVALSKTVPKIEIGNHCSDPYPCDFASQCWGHIPEVSIFNLVRMRGDKKWNLYEEGIIEFSQIPEDYQLSGGQRMQVESYLKQKKFVDKKAIREFVSSIEYGVYFMDFETVQFSIPLFDKSRPYQQLLFQYSLHYKSDKKAKLDHMEFLAEAKGDTRIPFIESLLENTKKPGTILIYSSFEITHLNKLISDFPQYKKDIEERISRTFDLMTPFQKRWYYAPEMNGSYSIKAVLPALISDLSYENMPISDGGTASAAFASLYNTTDKVKKETIRKNLKEYCKLDTFAMVKLLEHLESI